MGASGGEPDSFATLEFQVMENLRRQLDLDTVLVGAFEFDLHHRTAEADVRHHARAGVGPVAVRLAKNVDVMRAHEGAGAGATALAPGITQATWQRFFDANEPVFALVAEEGGQVLGIAHYLFHRSTTRIEPVCYLQDLFTSPGLRGRGVGRALIEGVYARAHDAGAQRVYWQTRESNAAGRLLYDKVGRHLGFIVYSHDA